MNKMRMGTVSLIVGLILLMNASSSHVPREKIHCYGSVGVNETQCYIILAAPVGVGNITIGFYRSRGSVAPPGFDDVVILPVHMKVDDPANQTLAEQDIVTPYSFEVVFKTRGSYKVYVTNKGTEESSIPVGVRFEGGPQNREKDKLLVSIALTALGAVLISTDMIMRLFSRRSQQQKSER